MWVYIVVAIIAYFIGSISFSVIFSRKFAGFDVREKGSKNAGTTNVLRTVGKRVALLTLICDIAKGVVAVGIAYLLSLIFKNINSIMLKYLAGLCAIIGHTFPIFFEFRGGKGVATALGVLLILNVKIGVICLIFGLILILLTRMVSVGSILSAILYPILILFMENNKNVGSVIISILIGLFIVFNHRENLKRLKSGTENKISFKK